MKTLLVCLGIFSVLVSIIVYLLIAQRGDDSTSDTTQPSVSSGEVITFDQATVYTCTQGAVIAIAYKTNDRTVMELSLPNVGPLILTNKENQYQNEQGYIVSENSGVIEVKKDGESIYATCTVGIPLAATSSTEVVGSIGANTSYRWVETTFATGTSVVPNAPEDFILTFAADNRFSANTDCNNIGGGYASVSSNELRFTDIISTRMACIGDTKEGEFILQLEQVSSYEMKDGELVMNIADAETSGQMKFVAL
ncbi:MAG: META domain-containing protein [Patescibacteria group bacterium]